MFLMYDLERAISRFKPRHDTNGDVPSRVSAASFRAMALERLRTVERDVSELKGRVNGLIFVVIGAVITQVVLRLAA
jgi:hypothetical protein